jgi:3-keto-disaccharide hydrolase
MRHTEWMWRLALSAGLWWVAGCASQPPKSAAQAAPSQESPAALASAVTEGSKITLPAGITQPPAPFEGEGWQAMFDGHDLDGWRATPFAGRGEVYCQQGVIVLNMGDPFTGINWTNNFPTMNYEVALDAMRVMGTDFFCGLTVPVGTNFCSLIVGGWGGSLVGISSLDDMDASENETTKFVNFQSGRWYRIRLRVTQKRIEGWIGDEKLVDVVTTGRQISVRPGDIELSEPFGLASWQTGAALREIKYRQVSGP